MKRNFLSTAILAMFSLSASAAFDWSSFFANEPICVQLSIDHKDHPIDRHAPALLPVLGYDNNTFVLSVPYELEDVTIVIRDEDGLVLYYDVVSSITDYYMFLLTDDIIADMYSIELYYGDWHLYGEF